MNELEQARLNAADHLGNAINTFITCDDRKVRRSILFSALDAITDYALEAILLNLYDRHNPKHKKPSINELQQAQLDAAHALVQFLEQPDDTDPPSTTTHRALPVVHAIAQYTLQLHDEQVIKNAGRLPSPP